MLCNHVNKCLLCLLILPVCCSLRTLQFTLVTRNMVFSRTFIHVIPRLSCRSLSARSIVDQRIPSSPEGVLRAAELLRQGQLVAFPTETVYGLGAHALNSTAVAKIFEAKGRPTSDPLIVHVHSAFALDQLFHFKQHQAERVCRALASTFWPGPLTIIHHAQASIPSIVTADSGFVGVRCPSHPLAQQLLEAADTPIAAPSANRFGHVSPTSAEHVYDDLGKSSPPVYILGDAVEETGGCRVGIESTVCHVSDDGSQLRILRCGAVTSSQLASCLDQAQLAAAIIVDNRRNQIEHSRPPSSIIAEKEKKVVSPGQMVKHYAPDLPTYTVSSSNTNEITPSYKLLNAEADSSIAVQVAASQLQSAMVIDFAQQLKHLADHCVLYVDLSPTGNVGEACNKLFQYLRMSESVQTQQAGANHVLLADVDRFLAGPPHPDVELLHALSERLHRASSGIKICLK